MQTLRPILARKDRDLAIDPLKFRIILTHNFFTILNTDVSIVTVKYGCTVYRPKSIGTYNEKNK